MNFGPKIAELAQNVVQTRAMVAALPVPVQGGERYVLALHSEMFSFAYGDFSARERTFTNGAEELHIARLVHSIMRDTTTFACDRDGYFDFGWSLRVGRTGVLYASPMNDTVYLSRRGLGYVSHCHELGFSHRFRIPPGERVSLRVKPLYFGTIDTTMVRGVCFTFVGYRTGVRA